MPLIELKGGYLVFTNHHLRKVYSNGGAVQIATSYPINHNFHMYGSVGFAKAWGESLNFQQKTTLWQIPVDVGIQPAVQLGSSTEWYATIGPRYFYVHQTNHSSFVSRDATKNGLGLFINTGFHFYPTTHFLIDLFSEYSYEPIRFTPYQTNTQARRLQIGGFLFGMGLGYAF